MKNMICLLAFCVAIGAHAKEVFVQGDIVKTKRFGSGSQLTIRGTILSSEAPTSPELSDILEQQGLGVVSELPPEGLPCKSGVFKVSAEHIGVDYIRCRAGEACSGNALFAQ